MTFKNKKNIMSITMRPVSNTASPISINVGERISPAGPITDSQGNLELQAGYTPKPIAIHVQLQRFQNVYEAMRVAESRPATGQFSQTGSELVIDRSLVYNPRGVAHSQIGMDVGGATINIGSNFDSSS
jgi:hypothetical protein